MKYGRMFVLMALSAVMVVAATGCSKEDKRTENTTNSQGDKGKEEKDKDNGSEDNGNGGEDNGNGSEDKGKDKTINSDDLIGKWISYSSDGVNVLTFKLQFNKDGSVVMSFSNGDPEEKFSWSLKATTLTLTKNGKNVSATFDGETIVVNRGDEGHALYIKEGDKGPGEEANRKNLTGTWIGSYRDEGNKANHKVSFVFNEDGKGSINRKIEYDDGREPENKSAEFTWTLTGVKLELKFTDEFLGATCYNGKKVLCFKELMFTKQ